MCPLWGYSEKEEEEEGKEKPPQELANFGLSGKLAKDQTTGNVYKGVVLKVSLLRYLQVSSPPGLSVRALCIVVLF